jgi:hypothetical protein
MSRALGAFRPYQSTLMRPQHSAIGGCVKVSDYVVSVGHDCVGVYSHWLTVVVLQTPTTTHRESVGYLGDIEIVKLTT